MGGPKLRYPQLFSRSLTAGADFIGLVPCLPLAFLTFLFIYFLFGKNNQFTTVGTSLAGHDYGDHTPGEVSGTVVAKLREFKQFGELKRAALQAISFTLSSDVRVLFG